MCQNPIIVSINFILHNLANSIFNKYIEVRFARPQYFQLYPNLNKKTEISVTGYEHYHGQYIIFTSSKKFTQINDGGIFYDIDTKVGQSGSPVYLFGDTTQLVGIHKGYDPSKNLNFATMITQQMIAVLKVWLKQMEVPFFFGNWKQNNAKRQSLVNQANQLWEEGNILKNKEKLQEAVECYNNSLILFQKINVNVNVDWANTFYKIGDTYYCGNQRRQALECYNKALLIYDKIEYESIEWANTLNNAGLVCFNQNKLEQAFDYYKRSLCIHQKLGKKSIELANTLHNIGDMHDQNEQPMSAIQYYNKSLTIHQNIGKESNNWANTLQSLSNVYKKQGMDKNIVNFLFGRRK